jgi:hypothetical protein
MKVVMNNGKKIVFLSGLIIGLSACGSSYDDILDTMEKKYNAKISYINAVADSTTFFLKSNRYTKDVYNSDYRVVELGVNESSREITHEWASGGESSKFAIEDTNSKVNLDTTKLSLEHKEKYWAVAWRDSSNDVISVFKKKISDTDGVYKIRVFANSKLPVKKRDSDTNLTTTVAGEVTSVYTIEGCADLFIGGKEVDLCQQGDLGSSYLVVVDSEGLITYTKE